MDRRTFLARTGAVLLAAPLTAKAQQPETMARVGALVFGRVPDSPEELAKAVSGPGFLRSMKELGWVEGQNIIIEWRWGESAAQLRASAAELVRLKVDVVVVMSGGLARIVQAETRTIPIVVIASGYDMVAAGFAASLARPGGNITGSQVLGADLIGKRLELLKELVPNLSRVAILAEEVTAVAMSPTANKSYSDAADVAARAFGIMHDWFNVARPEDLPAAFRTIKEKGDRGLLVIGSPFTWAHRTQIADLAATHRIAVIYDAKDWVEDGGLMSYGASVLALGRRAAAKVDKILKGAKPGDLPIEQPTTFELVINRRAAKSIGLTIPPLLLGRADQVIE